MKPPNRPIQPRQPQNEKMPQNARPPEFVPVKRKVKTHKFFGLFFLILTIYLIGHLSANTAGSSIDQVRIEMGYWTPPTLFPAVIVRDEVVHTATRSGELTMYVDNLARVRAGQTVASVRDATVSMYMDGLTQATYDAVARRLNENLQFNNASESNEQIINIASEIEFSWTASVLQLQEIGRTINAAFEVRNQAYTYNDPALTQVYTAAATGLSAAAAGIAANSAGIVSSYLDGLENVLTYANLSAVSTINIQAQYNNFAPTQEISAGQPAFRIMQSNDWYIVSRVAREYAASWNVGAQITIFVEQPDMLLPLRVHVYRLIDQGSEFYVVFSTNLETLRFMDQRNINFQLTQNPQEGLKVPRYAIVERSILPVPRDFIMEVSQVMVVERQDGNTVPVFGWLSNNGEHFYVLAEGDGLRAGDTIVHGHDEFTIDFVRVVQGVFVTNRGHSLFRQITLPENFDPQAEYIVLSVQDNPHIQLFDWIVADARDVDNRITLN